MNFESGEIPLILIISLTFEVLHFLASPHWRLSPPGVNVLNGHSKPKTFRKEGWEAKSTYLIQTSSKQIHSLHPSEASSLGFRSKLTSTSIFVTRAIFNPDLFVFAKPLRRSKAATLLTYWIEVIIQLIFNKLSLFD